MVQALASLTADLIRRRPADRIVFNIAQLTISWVLAGVALDAMGGTGLSQGEGLEASELPAVAVAAIVFFALNSTIVRVAEALQQSLPMFQHLVADLLFRSWSAGTLFVLGPPVAVVAENWLYLVPALALPMAAVHVASQQASAMERLALYDALTGLPNRSLLSQRTAQALRRATGDELGPALLTLDLDRFRDVNDTLGRAQGDALLARGGPPPRALHARERHGGPHRRRRVRRAAAGGGRPQRGRGGDDEAARRAEPADRGGRRHAQHRRQLRHRAVPRARPRQRAAAPARRDGDAPGQEDPVALRVLQARDGPRGAAPAGARDRVQARDRRAQHRAALPAQDRAGRAPRGGRRGAGALDRPGCGQRAAERLRAARGDDRPGRRLHPADARAGHRRRPALARGGLLACRWR